MLLLYLVILCSFFTDALSAKALEEEFADLIKIHKFSPAIRGFIGKILQAITIFDCYDRKVQEHKPFFTVGSEVTSTAFDALSGLKSAQAEYTRLVQFGLVSLRQLISSFRDIPNHVKGIENEDAECTTDEKKIFPKETCNGCKTSIPGFKPKPTAISELRFVILEMQETIPKQFLYYASDIFVIVTEGIRVFDKVYTCVTDSSKNKCDLKEKNFQMFKRQMDEVTRKERDHKKMIAAEKTKVSVLVEQLSEVVQYTYKAMSDCLKLQSGIKNVMGSEKVDTSLKKESEQVGVDLATANYKSTDRVKKSQKQKKSNDLASKLAKVRPAQGSPAQAGDEGQNEVEREGEGQEGAR